MTQVYFGTNRKPSPAQRPTNFGKEFSRAGLSDLRFGRADVRGNKVTVRTHQEKLVQDGDRNFTDSERSVLGSQALFDDLRHRMKKEGSDTIIFIHGYNVTFKEAMKATAQIARNFRGMNGGQGVNAICFSWPSDGSMKPWVAYSSDRRDAAASGPAFARGLLKLADFVRGLDQEDACERQVHLVAHSMGNYVLRHALQEIRRQTSGRIPRLFDQIFLMAADEDDDAFEHDHKLRLLPRLGRQVSVYFNRGDRAMSISDLTKGNPDRLGDDGPRAPFQVPGKVVQVDCSRVVSGAVEHSYYLDERRVVQDMEQVMRGMDPRHVGNREFLDDRNRFVLRKT